MRSPHAILIDTVRTQAELVETYFTAKAEGVDELALRRIQQQVQQGAAAARGIATQAEVIERTKLAAFEARLAVTRPANIEHPEPPSAA